MPSEEQKQRAIALCKSKACPDCGRKLSLLELLCMVRGGGFTFYVEVKTEDGRYRSVREEDFDPQTMELIGPTALRALSPRQPPPPPPNVPFKKGA
jgi:hypothetical protein